MFTEAFKRSCFRTPFGNQRVNGFQTLLKWALHYYCPIFPWIRDKLIWKKSALVLSEIFRLFVNSWLPMTSITVAIRRFSCNNFKRHYLEKKRPFLDFLLHCRHFHEIWNILKKKTSVPTYFLPILLHEKEIFSLASKCSCFRTPFGNQGVNEFQPLLKLTRHHFFSVNSRSIKLEKVCRSLNSNLQTVC